MTHVPREVGPREARADGRDVAWNTWGARGLDLGPPGTRTGKEDPPREPPGVRSPGPSLTLDRTVKGQTALFSGPGCGHSLFGPGPVLATLLPRGPRPERPAALTTHGAARSCSPRLRHPGLGTVYELAEPRHLLGGRGSCPWRRTEPHGTRQVAECRKRLVQPPAAPTVFSGHRSPAGFSQGPPVSLEWRGGPPRGTFCGRENVHPGALGSRQTRRARPGPKAQTQALHRSPRAAGHSSRCWPARPGHDSAACVAASALPGSPATSDAWNRRQWEKEATCTKSWNFKL